MRLVSLARSGFMALLALPNCVQVCAHAQELSANSTIRVATAGERAVTNQPAAGASADRWGESELRFELSPTETRDPTAGRNGAPPTYPVTQASFSAETATKPPAPPASVRSRAVTGVYTNPSATATLSRIPRPAPLQSSAGVAPTGQGGRPRGKPFQTVESGPTVSPYLNLYRNDANTNTISNYYTFVRPQLDQIEANRRQAADMQRMRVQLQSAQSAGGGSPVMYGGNAGRTAPVARFGDTAQFYQRTRR